MDAFNEYKKIANQTKRIQDSDVIRRSEWQKIDLEKEIVKKAMIGLCSMLYPDFEPSINVVSENVYSIAHFITYRGCRIQILGTTEVKYPPQSLLNEAADKARETIVLCILASAAVEILDPRKFGDVYMRTGVIPFYPTDIDALAFKRVTFEQLIEYKLFRRILLEKPDCDTQYSERLINDAGCQKQSDNACFISLKQAIEQRGEKEESWIEHPFLRKIDDSISRRQHNLLLGYSSSGKTILAFQVAQRRISSGWQVQYVNLSDDISTPAGIVQKLLFTQNHKEKAVETSDGEIGYLLIVDDLQSNPALARIFLVIGSLLHRVRDGERPILLGISWKEFAPEASKLCPESFPTVIHADLIRRRLIEKYSKSMGKEIVEKITQDAGDDIYLLNLLLEHTTLNKSRAGRDIVAKDLWERWVSSANNYIQPQIMRRVALLVASIGQFDIHVTPNFVKNVAKVDYSVISKLSEIRLLRKIGDRMTLGHRSLCALMTGWLGKNNGWNDLAIIGGPQDVPAAVFNYLSASGTAAMVDAIHAIVARTGFKNSEALSHRAMIIKNVWRAFDAVVERVETQQIIDPTWGNTPSSCMFVTVLFSEIGKVEKARKSIDFLRTHWCICDNHINIDTSGFSTVVDFNLLHQRMIEEDRLNEAPIVTNAEDIDVERFHKTWLAGLILGAEAAYDSPRIPLNELATYMEEEYIQKSGAFYPERVPWCTARVILGLAACGRSVTTSTVVKRAVEWLMRERSDGGASSGGIWYSGTGTWNSTVETTALVILALVRAGVDPASNDVISVGRKFLLENRDNWYGFEGAVAIEALLASGSEWEELAEETERLAKRALEQSLWQSATLPADEILQQTCHVAQAATHLVGIGWTAIRSDLADLLEALDLPDSVTQNTTNTEERKYHINQNEVVVRQKTGDQLAISLKMLNELKLSRYSIVGDYLRFDDRARNELIIHCKSIMSSLNKKTLNRENHLIWAPPGSGKTFFISEIGRQLKDNCSFHEINLAKLNQEQFVSEIKKLSEIENVPVLCMIDEIDSWSKESWPYEELFSCLDWNMKEDRHIIFVLAGSGGMGLNGMMRGIQERPKGTDMLDRIPNANRFEIPNQVIEDRMIVFAKNVLLAAAEREQKLKSIDALALFYVVKSDNLSTNRQISEIAKAAISRMDSDDNCLLYDHMFRNGDIARMEFYSRNVESAELLQGKNIWIEN